MNLTTFPAVMLAAALIFTQLASAADADPNASAAPAVSPAASPAQAFIDLKADGTIVYQDKPFTSQEMTTQLTQLYKTSPGESVVIRCQKNVPAKALYDLLNRCKVAGLRNVTFAAAPEASPAAN